MAERQYRASLSKGRSGWCVIFRHPTAPSPDGKQKLRVRRGLGTRDEAEAQRLVGQLNEILADPSYHNLAARTRAASKFSEQIVAAFFDHITPEQRDGWAERERILPLPSKEDGYAKVLMVGTTGAGKTTVVRQIIGTDPATERFPSTSAAKTTICDLEIITGGDSFDAAVSFIPREQARHYIMECVTAAVSAHLENSQPSEIVRRFMEHSEQRFRLSYLLGSLNPPKAQEEDEDELFDDESEVVAAEASEVSHDEQVQFAERLKYFLGCIDELAADSREVFQRAAQDLNIATPQDRDTLQDLVEEELLHKDSFHALVDEILDEVELRFEFIKNGSLVKSRDGWPTIWTFSSDDREEFIRSVNRFSSNYAPSFGHLLTPLVEGIRVRGPFAPSWANEDDVTPQLVLMDGQGIGHTADSTSSISTGITKRFQIADAILLTDNAAQPMQAAPVSVLRTLVASGHESKLIVTFTHFDEVKGDNLIGTKAQKEHVVGSFFNAVQAIGKSSGREAEHALKRLHPDRLVFLASIQSKLPDKARFTRNEFSRMLALIEASIQPPPPVAYRPVYDVANLVLAVQKATQEFHDRWKALLGMGSRSNAAPEHWTRIKALTRRVGVFKLDEYDNLRPIADLILRLQDRISAFLSEPLEWSPSTPPESAEEERTQAIDAIRKHVYTRLHDLSHRRLIDERVSGWVEAYERRGTGSTRVRAREIVDLYESAAPIPNEMPGPDANEFLFELRELVAESVVEGGGDLRGWTRQPLPAIE